MSSDDIVYRIALGLLPGIGDIYARRLVERLGSPEAVFRESYRSLVKIPGIGSRLASAIKSEEPLRRAAEELNFINRHNIKTLFYTDEGYPRRLRECPDSPIMIYYRGNLHPDAAAVLSIVGTRNITARGKSICNDLVEGLAERHPGLVIVSGLAYGVDICAHRAALRTGLPTIGVMAHGFNFLYPSAHTGVAKEMTKSGALVTDFVSGVKPDRQNFLKRNRIVAGMSDATLVIESGEKGGAMVTAEIAGSYNREVLAVPGFPGEPVSAGCNLLIKSQRGTLIEKVEDIDYFLNWKTEKSHSRPQAVLPLAGTTEASVIGHLEAHGKLSADRLSELTGMPIHQLSPLLLTMEFAGYIRAQPGNYYILT